MSETQTRNIIIECTACQTRFSLNEGQLAGMINPRFHCSHCDHYFDLACEEEDLEVFAPEEDEELEAPEDGDEDEPVDAEEGIVKNEEETVKAGET